MKPAGPGGKTGRPTLTQPVGDAYPAILQAAEAKLLAARRQAATMDPAKADYPPGVVGLALSGGGIRSAIFNLGLLQAFAKARRLRTVDFLSTASGGGYIGAFLGRYYTRFVNRPRGATDIIETRLADADGPEVRWLRQNGSYLAPGGTGDGLFNAGVYLRNFLTLQLVMGLFLLALYGCANGFRFGFLPWLAGFAPAWVPQHIVGLLAMPVPTDFQVNHTLQEALGLFWSP